jgi:hypothetical protein
VVALDEGLPQATLPQADSEVFLHRSGVPLGEADLGGSDGLPVGQCWT